MNKDFENLTIYEKSFMLVLLLFSRKNLEEILLYLPSESQNKIKEVIPMFLFLSQSDRVTKIIMELKKLLNMADEVKKVDDDKISEALINEPEYMKNFILNLRNKDGQLKNKYSGLVLQEFMRQF